MSYIVLKDSKSSQLIPTRVYEDPGIAQSILQPTRWRILNQLIAGRSCAKDLAEAMRTSEQVICYHLKELERAQFIKLDGTEKKRGAVAKYYRAEQRAITVLTNATGTEDGRVRHSHSLSGLAPKLLDPFVSEGRLNALIVLGSPEPHGVFRAAARDSDRAVDLALFLGSLLPLTRESLVRLDTELSQQQLLRNLILVGSPRVNTVTMMMNEWLPITYELPGQDLMMSRLTNNSYAANEGAIQLIPNPMEQNSHILVVAGNNELGTRAAILAFIQHTEEIAKGNSANSETIARVVNGLDSDNDGILDDVEFLE
jgi:DNA-binding MarR family transcriptional regulator